MRLPRRRGSVGGFTLIEVLMVVVILGILATVVIPQLTSASQQARESTLKDELRYLRTQIEVFKAQHQDVPPGYPDGVATSTPTSTAFSAQMTEYSDANFDLSAAQGSYPFGPYLTQMPANPVNGMSTCEMVGNNQPMPAPDGTTGWIYKPQTQEITANLMGDDNSGTPYSTY